MQLSGTTRVRRARQAEFRRVGDDEFEIRLNEDVVYLDGVAGTLWRLFDGRRSLDDAVAEIKAAYDAPPDVAEDVTSFVEEMLARGFLAEV
jgi:hypothetical protein